LPAQDIIDGIYLEALDVPPSDIEREHRKAIELLRRGPVRVTTSDGTDIRFDAGPRPFCSQIGDASRERMQLAQTRIDRDIELPAGVLRVAPVETSANGTIFLKTWKPIFSEGHNLMLTFRDGFLEKMDGENASRILVELSSAGGASRMFREFALGFNPALRIRQDHPFIAYYGYGSGIVRLSLGDNEEMGGLNRDGGVYWNFIPNASVFNGDGTRISP
jgi:leucyl aminopeptidase (aminopeptidase T)